MIFFGVFRSLLSRLSGGGGFVLLFRQILPPRLARSPLFFIPLLLFLWCFASFFLLRTPPLARYTATETVPLVGRAPPAEASSSHEKEAFSPAEMIYHHIQDSHVWHFWEGPYGILYLPVILYSADRGWEFFSSRRFFTHAYGKTTYRGYRLVAGARRIEPVAPERHIWDFSITKNVATLLILSSLIFLTFAAIARSYTKRGALVAPRGIQSLMEPIIVFVAHEVARPCIGKKHYKRYLPYLLTLFLLCFAGQSYGANARRCQPHREHSGYHDFSPFHLFHHER